MKFNPQFNNMVLPVAFGMYSTRQLAIRDFTRMPHLLIGGMTGTGKSMFLHSFVCSLVEKHSPEKVLHIEAFVGKVLHIEAFQ